MPKFSHLDDVPRGPRVPRWDPPNRMVCEVVYLNRVKCYVYLIETKGLQCHSAIRVLQIHDSALDGVERLHAQQILAYSCLGYVF